MFNFLSHWRNRLIAFLFDVSMIPVAWFGAYWLLFDFHKIPSYITLQASLVILLLFAFQAPLFWMFGLYRGVWRFASIPDLLRITKAVASGTVVILMIFYFLRGTIETPRAVPVFYGMILGTTLAGARIIYRWLKDYRRVFFDSERVLIVGGGFSGEGLIRDLLRHDNHHYQPVALADDDPAKLKREIHGVTVVGTCDDIPVIVQKHKIDLILIAIPAASSVQMRRIVNLCEKTKLPFRTLPSLNDLATGRVDVTLLRNVSLEDLLGRDQVQLDWQTLAKEFHNKVILVSGGGGSIGSELCRQIARINPKKLIIIDSCEYNLYSIDMELNKKFPNLNLVSVLLDITDRAGVQKVFSTHLPEMVFHAAAYKHVPLLEGQGRIAIHNNILGTHTLTSISASIGVKKFVLISTDKAVNPTNLMGATKRAAEMICQNLYENSLTKFITVRFGNVLDSAGSVVPLFRKQIQEGGPITVTHPDITRYFMSIPEAAQLIMQAAGLGKGNEIFVLDMGEPIKIHYLAEQMSKLAGKKIGHDIDIVYTGLRPGEKLYEELFYANEKLNPTVHNKILLASACRVDKNLLIDVIDKMELAYRQVNDEFLYCLLEQLVPKRDTAPELPKEKSLFSKNNRVEEVY